MFGFMAGGGKLVIAAPGGEKDTQYLARMCKQHDVASCTFIPSQLDALLRVSPLLFFFSNVANLFGARL